MTEKRIPLAKFIKEYSVRNKSNENIPVYSVTNSQGFCTEYFGKEIASQDKTNYKIVPKGYFAYNPSRINVGSVDWQRKEEKVIVSPLYNVFSVSDELDRQYLYYFLQSDICKQMINAKSSGSVRNNLKLEALKEMTIPDIKIEEQRFRSTVLDNIKNIINSRLAELEKLDDLIKARFVEMFGDPNIEFKFETHKFKEFAFDMTKGPFGSDMKKELFVPKSEDTYKVYIQSNAIQRNQDLGDYYISKEYFNNKVSRFEVHPGDYIITCDGTLGKHLKLNAHMERGVISPSLLKLTLNENKMTKEYFESMWDMYMLLLMKNQARNACLIHLPSSKVIGEIDIPVAPFNLQLEFSSFVEQIDKSKLAVRQSLEKTQQLYDSLMQEYFG